MFHDRGQIAPTFAALATMGFCSGTGGRYDPAIASEQRLFYERRLERAGLDWTTGGPSRRRERRRPREARGNDQSSGSRTDARSWICKKEHRADGYEAPRTPWWAASGPP